MVRKPSAAAMADSTCPHGAGDRARMGDMRPTRNYNTKRERKGRS